MAIQALSDIQRAGVGAFEAGSGTSSTVALSQLLGGAATPGQVITWNGQGWVPYDILGGNNVPPGFMSAVGGNIVLTDGDYKVHIFTSSGSLSILQNGVLDELLVVGGGGGGGSRHGGGGGGGEVVRKVNHVVTVNQVLTVTIGPGGTGCHNSSPLGTNGGDTVFGPIIAKGGGRGGGIQYGGGQQSGGSGAGGTSYSSYTAGMPGVSSTNLSGGTSYVNSGGSANTSDDFSGGGGGGGGEEGGSPTSFPGNYGNTYLKGGKGGDGYLSSITGTAARYGPGGAGSSCIGEAPSGVTGPLGGLGGGGNGGWTDSNYNYYPASSGTGPGAGGGGSRNSSVGGNGYRGEVIVRYRFK